jgi:hypothetical protein
MIRQNPLLAVVFGQYFPFCCEQIDGGCKQEYITNER